MFRPNGNQMEGVWNEGQMHGMFRLTAGDDVVEIEFDNGEVVENQDDESTQGEEDEVDQESVES